ncbi:glycoside hydrolase superfamily [Kalaharituber pfeilii]|nr:glycoside hydrolase superfamily [Kalaharituber pfeilii]
MYAVATCRPPLGATTAVDAPPAAEPIHFTAILDLPEQTHRQHETIVAELWYGADGDPAWRGARFSDADPDALAVLNAAPARRQKHYTLHLDCPRDRPISFTLRFKLSSDAPWLWARDLSSQPDGRLVFRSAGETASPTFQSLFQGTDASVAVQQVSAQVPGTTVWNLSAPCAPTSTQYCSLGTPAQLEQFYSLVKVASPWLGPRHGTNTMAYDRDALLVGFLRSDGRHVVVMGVSAVDDCNTYLTGDGALHMKTRNDGATEQTHKAIVATGMKWQATVDAVFYRAREMLGYGGYQVDGEKDGEITPQWKEEWYDGLAYCTWNGLGRELTEERILDALDDLFKSGISVSTLIIDDNWQTLISRKWDAFEADPTNFPRGLKATVQTIKQRFPQVKHVIVWHAMFGYWDGVAPGGWVDKNYKCETLKWHEGHEVRVVSAEDVGRCYDDFYRFLLDCGVDGTKTDVQASIDELDNGADRQRISKAYQDAFKLASLKHFSRKAIYCMAMQPFIFWRSLLTHNIPPAVVRNSDDFFPDIPSSHNWHIFTNAMSNIFTSRLNGVPDWDMFQSSLPTYGSLHAAARCISGGPIYITDIPGEHDVGLVNRMVGTGPRGNSVVLRPSLVAQPTNPFVPYNGSALLRVSNFSGGHGGNSFLAVFNVSSNPITEVVTLNDFPGIVPTEHYVIRAFAANTVVSEGTRSDRIGHTISLTLDSSGWEFFTATRVEERARGRAQGDTFWVGCFGLMDKIAGGVAVLAQNVTVVAEGRVRVTVTLKALGVMGFYISDLHARSIPNMLITISGNPVPAETVYKGDGSGLDKILYFDVLRAWKAMGMDGGANWSGEVEVVLRLD